MFKTPMSGILFGASKVSTKLFVPSSGLHVTAPMKLKEIHANKVGSKLIIEGSYIPSPRKDHVIQNNSECCSLCNLGLNVKHTDVLILSQFVRPDGCMMPQRITGLCKTQQKRMSKLVSMAHKAGLMCNLAPDNSKKDPTKRKLWKKYNTYFDESTIKIYESHFKTVKENIILDYMKSKKSEN
ncbi:28S ribosomal protein S18a, mitochondrial [Rhopalosiphum maidis]|uniref:28S ribosomal protein S18a, mitochondrial n=1 Tax=Rhopalosiphum maidis TaxID=43146 RepID=UPI000F004B9C|nr:28S ribosomal protein S18a, mitochondrial [Rhopalosiphum maidis]